MLISTTISDKKIFFFNAFTPFFQVVFSEFCSWVLRRDTDYNEIAVSERQMNKTKSTNDQTSTGEQKHHQKVNLSCLNSMGFPFVKYINSETNREDPDKFYRILNLSSFGYINFLSKKNKNVSFLISCANQPPSDKNTA